MYTHTQKYSRDSLNTTTIGNNKVGYSTEPFDYKFVYHINEKVDVH